MTKQQILRFADKIGKCNIIIAFCSNHNKDGLHAYVIKDTPHIIFIHFKDFNSYPLIEQKETLMHEVGHVKTLYLCHRNQTQEEFQAQMWGIEKAKELGMTQIVRAMEKTLKVWTCLDWNTSDRKYILAGRLAKEKGII
jgi:hypothetical protein